MDFEEEDVVDKAKDSGFLDDSSLADMFVPGGLPSDIPQDLSEIQKAGSEDQGENQLDQCVIEDTGDDREDEGNGLSNILKDVLQDDEPDSAELRKVHKFTKPILTEEELAIYRQEPLNPVIEEEVEISPKSQGKAVSPPKGIELQYDSGAKTRAEESPKEERMRLEGEEVRTSAWRCGSCLDEEQRHTLMTFCSLF